MERRWVDGWMNARRCQGGRVSRLSCRRGAGGVVLLRIPLFFNILLLDEVLDLP